MHKSAVLAWLGKAWCRLDGEEGVRVTLLLGQVIQLTILIMTCVKWLR